MKFAIPCGEGFEFAKDVSRVFDNSININDEMYVSFDNFKKQLIFFKKKNLLISYNDFLKIKKK